MTGSTRSGKPVLVLGVGNVIQTDDGVGVHAVERLQSEVFPEEVELVDGGTAGLDLLAVISGRRRLIVIDAVNGDMAPGTLFRFTPEDLGTQCLRFDSLHQIGLLETLQMAELTACAPDRTVIFGVQPETIDWGTELTPAVAAVMERLLRKVREEVDAAVESCRSMEKTKSNNRVLP